MNAQQDLVRHLVEPAVSNPEAVEISAVEGDDVLLLKLSVADEDRELFSEDRNVRAIRTIVSAAAGSRKASVELVSDDEKEEDVAGDDDAE